MDITFNTVEYAGREINVNDLPVASINALIRRGITHYLGNEQAAKVTNWAKSEDEKREQAGTTLVSLDERKTYKESCIANAYAVMVGGEMGMSVRGEPVDPVEAEIEKLAKAEIANILRAADIKVPTKGKAVKFPDGSAKTMDEMLETRISKFGDRLRNEAEKIIRAKEKAREKAKSEVAALPVASAEALGL